MIPYIELTLDFAVVNVNVDGEATLNIKGNYFNGNFGAASNILGIQYRYKEKMRKPIPHGMW